MRAMFHSKRGRFLAYLVITVSFPVWVLTATVHAGQPNPRPVLFILIVAYAGYLIGAGWDKVRLERQRRRALRAQNNREGS